MTQPSHEQQLERLIRGTARMMAILRAARACDLPEWAVGAGVLRSLVWDHLHARAQTTTPNDVDVAFFDPHDLTPERDAAAQATLHAALSDVPWEATNQAAVHLWSERVFGTAVPPLISLEDGVATWPETATCVAVRLLPDDRLHMIAPFGLADLFGMMVRRNPRRVTIERFRQRIEEKQIRERWPRVTIVDM